MPDPTNSASQVRVTPIWDAGKTFDITPTTAEKKKIVAARVQRAKQGYGFQRPENGRHRLVGFGYNKALPKPAHLKYIRDTVLKEAKSFGGKPRFWVAGYASRSGAAAGNQSLSLRRARAVAQYIQRLVPNARVDVQAFGESSPYRAGAADGSEDFMDRAVEIGVSRQTSGRVAHTTTKDRAVEQQDFMRKTFRRFLTEANYVALLKTIDFPNLQTLLQATSGRSKTITKNNILKLILDRSWPLIHKRYPDLSVKQVVDALRGWHASFRRGR